MNRIIFITGATSGIGKACAEKFAAAGDNLILNGRRGERLKELSASLQKSYGIKVLFLVFDVQDRKAVFDSIENIPAEWKQIDILINNAGLAAGRAHIDEADLDDFDTMLHTNVNGLLYVTKAVLPFMTKRHTGHIINMGSVAGKEIYDKGNVYCASKFAVDALSHSMRIDLLKHRIKVTAIHPGAVRTEFGIVRFKGDEEKAESIYKGWHPLEPEDVADAILYCSNLPANVCINDLVITAIQQADSIYFDK